MHFSQTGQDSDNWRVKESQTDDAQLGFGDLCLSHFSQNSPIFIFPSFMKDEVYKNSSTEENVQIHVGIMSCH